MRRFLGTVIAVLAVGIVSACATAPARDLSGDWRFRVEVSAERVTHGAFRLEPAPGGYVGVLTTDRGDNQLPVQSFTLTGANVAMVVISPDGTVTFEGQLSDDAGAMHGTMTYHNGERYPMHVTRGA